MLGDNFESYYLKPEEENADLLNKKNKIVEPNTSF